jgi:hypothetical protein
VSVITAADGSAALNWRGFMIARSLRRRARVAAVGSVVLVGAVAAVACTPTTSSGPGIGFTAINTPALACSATGLPKFASDVPAATQLMQAGDPAQPILPYAPIWANKVGRVNDMNALSPDGKYLYTVSENGTPSENAAPPTDSDGVTRLTLATGKKQVLANNVDGLTQKWSRVDGIKWYPFGGPGTSGAGVLLASEEFAAGGIWQINPDTGAFVRLDWLGNFAHEGIGLDGSGNLYLGDENRTGAIYKAVPTDPTDLTLGGTLSYMVGTGIDPSGWKQVANPATAIAEANNGGAILFDRPEDFDEHNGRVYFTVTEPKGDSDPRHGNYNGTPAGGVDALLNQVVNRGGVYTLSTVGVPDLSTQSGALPAYTKLTPMIEVNDPTYATQADAQAQQGLQFPDNIAFDGYGHLWVHEDIPDNNGSFPASGVDVSKQARNQQDELYVYTLTPNGQGYYANGDTSGPGISGGYKAADMQSSNPAHPCENEFTGGIFANDGKTLYINQQHWENPTVTTKIN